MLATVSYLTIKDEINYLMRVILTSRPKNYLDIDGHIGPGNAGKNSCSLEVLINYLFFTYSFSCVKKFNY